MKRGPFQIAVALDELLNALAWGSARQTVSTRAWLAKVRGKAWGKVAVAILDRIFGAGHCERSAARAAAEDAADLSADEGAAEAPPQGAA